MHLRQALRPCLLALAYLIVQVASVAAQVEFLLQTLPFGDLAPYLSANLNQDLGGGKNFTGFSLTPGVRFFVGWHTYFITGSLYRWTNQKPFEPGLTAVVSRGC